MNLSPVAVCWHLQMRSNFMQFYRLPEPKKPPHDLTNGGFKKLVESLSVEGVETFNSQIQPTITV